MTPAPLVPDRLATGRIIDLANPGGEIVWLHEMAGPAARLNRFAGQIPDMQYSVGEHEVRGASAIFREQLAEIDADGLHAGPVYRARLIEALIAALAFLLHDQHETLGGDVKRPFTDLCDLLAAQNGLAQGGVFRKIVDQAKYRLDVWIYGEAGIDFPLAPLILKIVSAMDERMAAEEMRRFWPDTPLPLHYRDLKRIALADWPMGHAPTVWEWPHTQAQWIEHFNRWRTQLRELGGGHEGL